MRKFFVLCFMAPVMFPLSSFKGIKEEKHPALYPTIIQYLQNAEKEFDQIPAERKLELKKIADYVQTKLKEDKKASLIYICTHNSRRSHMGQLWAMAAAEFYGIKGISSYSGGLEITAFNPNAIKALDEAGFKISKKADASNPDYESRYSDNAPPVISFSKKYMDAPNPTSNFIAVMTCSHADQNCPIVKGASLKVATPYEDPKEADGKPNQDDVYRERCEQIATEVLYTFSLINTDK